MRYLLFLAVLFLAACQTPTKINTLDITIEGAEADSKLVVKGPGFLEEYEIVDGVVNQEFNIDKAGVFVFNYKRNSLQTYVEPGETISFSGKAGDLSKSAVFQGDHESVWTYFKDKTKIMRSDLSPRKMYSMQPAEFLSTLTDGTKKLSDNLEKASIPASLKVLETEGLMLNSARERYVYPLYTDKNMDDLSDDFKDPLAGISLVDEAKYLVNGSYARLVQDHFSINMYKDTTGEYEEVFQKHIAALPAGNIRNNLLYNDMRNMMGPNDNLDKNFQFFKDHSSDAKHLAKLQKAYDELASLSKGNPSPTFDYENYKGGKSILEDYKGKYVYVDVWATWCGPCKAEIPALKAKEAKYHDSNIEFVSISIDEEKAYDAWRDMVKDKELGGSQLMADNAWQSKFVQEYQIKGIPRFILIDPEGKIVSADAPRPSSDKLDETLQALNI